MRTPALSLAALVVGASALGTSPIWVRFSDLPSASVGFWRVGLAAIVFAMVWRFWPQKQNRDPLLPGPYKWHLIAGGIFFGLDMWLWNAAVNLSTVGKATLLACLAPIYVTLYVVFVLKQKLRWHITSGLSLALLGTVLLIVPAWEIRPDASPLGDILGFLGGICYGGYIIAVAAARDRLSTLVVMTSTSAAAAVLLLLPALASGSFFPPHAFAWTSVFALALFCHVFGQGLIAYALAKLPVIVGSIGLLLQPVSATILGWIIFGEAMNGIEITGALLVILSLILINAVPNNKQPAAKSDP